MSTNMFDLDQETIDALKDYEAALADMATSLDYASREFLSAQKNLIHAGQGLQGFLKDVHDYARTHQIKARKS